MENNDYSTGYNPTPELKITNVSKSYLLETAKWAKFLAIVGFIGMALMVLMGLFAGSMMNSMSEFGGPEAGIINSTMGFMYIIIGAIYFFPLYFLYKFADNTKEAVVTQSDMSMEEALRYQKSLYKFMGIFTVVILVLYLLIIVFGALFLAAR